MSPAVSIENSAENIEPHSTVVVVDVIRATTTAITAVAQGRRCVIAATLESLDCIVPSLVDDPLLVGEIAGVMPDGFHLNNSPARLAANDDRQRPVVLLSSTGSPLMRDAADSGLRAYAACLRNLSAQIRRLVQDRNDVVLLAGADDDGMRVEDELCCGLIASGLIEAGFTAAEPVRVVVKRSISTSLDAIRGGRSAAYLARSDQLDDLEFILDHVDDIDAVFTIEDAEVVAAAA